MPMASSLFSSSFVLASRCDRLSKNVCSASRELMSQSLRRKASHSERPGRPAADGWPCSSFSKSLIVIIKFRLFSRGASPGRLF